MNTTAKHILIIFVIALLIPLYLNAQKNYAKNSHIKYNKRVENGKYIINYTFKDHWNKLRNIHLEFDKEKTDRMIKQYGIPESMFDPFISTLEVKKKRSIMLRNGLFTEKGKQLVPDKSALVAYYSDVFCKPIARQIVNLLIDEGRDTRNQRIEMTMRLVQDIPYGVPANTRNKIYTGGLVTPPEILTQFGYGDCDSKAVLFVGIMSYLVDPYDILFIGIPGHVLTAIRAEPIPGQTYYIMQDGDYVIAETAGPGRKGFGQKGDHYTGSARIERIDLKSASYSYVDPDELIEKMNAPISKKPKSKNAIRIENKSGKRLVFRLSPNGQNWNQFSLANATSYDYDFGNQSYGYFRISTNKKVVRYRIYSFRDYYISWNADRGIFDLYYYK